MSTGTGTDDGTDDGNRCGIHIDTAMGHIYRGLSDIHTGTDDGTILEPMMEPMTETDKRNPNSQRRIYV